MKLDGKTGLDLLAKAIKWPLDILINFLYYLDL